MNEATKAYLCEAFMEWAGLDDMNDDTPSNITIPHANSTNNVKKEFMCTVIGNFVDAYVLSELDVEKEWRTKHQNQHRDVNGK